MAMTQDEAKASFEELLGKAGLSAGSADYTQMLSTMMDRFNAATDKDAFVQSMGTIDVEKPSVDNAWQTLSSRYQAFIDSPADNYGAGYDVDAIAFINREKARGRNDVTYLDPHTVRKEKTLIEDIQAQDGKTKKYLLTGTASVLADENTSSDLKTFLTTLKDRGLLDQYEHIVIPLAFLDEPGKTEGHATTLVWDVRAKAAMIVDQCGGDASYPQSKAEVKRILGEFGVGNVSYNQEALTGENRKDCACVSSMVVNDVLAGKGFSDFTAGCYGSDADTSRIDANHQNDQKLLQQALFNMYKNSPVFQLYCETKNINWDSISDDEKKRVMDDFKLFQVGGDFNSGDRSQESPDNDFIRVVKPYMDAIWEKHPKRQFTQYRDEEYPNALAYKHQDGSKVIITSETSAQIESRTLEDHLVICEYAKNMGCKNIDFGPYFKTHLDEAALLYLAALKTGMGIKNAPDIEKFKDLPQYDEIKLRQTVQQELKDLQEKKEALTNDPDYKRQREIMAQHVGEFKAFLNSGSPQQQAWVDLTEANKAAKKAREDLNAGLEHATPEAKAVLDKVRAEQHKNRDENRTESVSEILTRLSDRGQQPAPELATEVEGLIQLHDDLAAKRAAIHPAVEAFKAEIPNITAPGAKEYCEAFVAAQGNPAYKAYREAEAGYKGRVNAAFDEYFRDCTPEQRVERIVALKERMSGQKVSAAESAQIKDNSYQPDGQKAQDKCKENIVQAIYAQSYRGM